MNSCVLKVLPFFALAGSFASGFASPLGSRLLSLVPPGCEIVAGFENISDPARSGRLLLTTHNNRMDLDDWQALAGVDHNRIFNEIIEASTASSGGVLTEHLLLVAGHFEGERIFRSAEQNGSERIGQLGHPALAVKPFAREKNEMTDLRWLVIIDNRIALFGSPTLIQRALQRYGNHYVPDPILEERLSQLRSDVTSWNVLVLSRMPFKDILFAQPDSPWAHLLEDADLVMVGTHFGRKVRWISPSTPGAAGNRATLPARPHSSRVSLPGRPPLKSIRTVRFCHRSRVWRWKRSACQAQLS
jgi:hypothetical protein